MTDGKKLLQEIEELNEDIQKNTDALVYLNMQHERTEKAEREDHYDRCMRNAMYLALNDLEQMNPKWHSMIITYYFGCNVTQADLGEKYGVSRQSISQTLGRAILLLRHRANYHLKRLLNE